MRRWPPEKWPRRIRRAARSRRAREQRARRQQYLGQGGRVGEGVVGTPQLGQDPERPPDRHLQSKLCRCEGIRQVAGKGKEGRWRRAGHGSHLPSLHQARWLRGGKAGGGGQAAGLTCLLSTKPGGCEEGGQVAEGRPWVSPAFSPPSQVAGWRVNRRSHLPSLHQASWLGGGRTGGGGWAVGLTWCSLHQARWLRGGKAGGGGLAVGLTCLLSTNPGGWAEGGQVAEGGPWVSPAISQPSQVAGWRVGRGSYMPSLHQARWLGGGRAGGGGWAVCLTCLLSTKPGG